MENTSEDFKKLLPHTTVLDDEVFEETEIMTMISRNDEKKRKSRWDFFCSKPSNNYNIFC